MLPNKINKDIGKNIIDKFLPLLIAVDILI